MLIECSMIYRYEHTSESDRIESSCFLLCMQERVMLGCVNKKLWSLKDT
jgi:hypothetical protein